MLLPQTMLQILQSGSNLTVDLDRQIVIPQNIREELGLEEGTPFAVFAEKDSILLKKIEKPKVKSWAEVTKPFRKAAEKAGLKEEDVDDIVYRIRAKKK